MKRTTLSVDAALLEKARKALGARTNSETVTFALSEVVRRKKVLALRELFGSNFWEATWRPCGGRGFGTGEPAATPERGAGDDVPRAFDCFTDR